MPTDDNIVLVRVTFGHTESDKLAAEVRPNVCLDDYPKVQSAINECCQNIMKELVERFNTLLDKEVD